MSETEFVDSGGTVRIRGTLVPPPGGGSQTYKVVRVPIVYNTAGLVSTGVTLYTPAPGDAVLYDRSYMTIPTTPFAGSEPILNVNLTFSDLASAFGNATIGGLQDGVDGTGHNTYPAVSVSGFTPLFPVSGIGVFPDATPLLVVADDGSGGNPGFTAGEGEIVLVIIPA